MVQMIKTDDLNRWCEVGLTVVGPDSVINSKEGIHLVVVDKGVDVRTERHQVVGRILVSPERSPVLES